MNIAFYTYNECCPTIGGTERTTAIVADSLNKYHGHNVFSIYRVKKEDNVEEYKFYKTYMFSGSKDAIKGLISFIKDNDISLVINQGDFNFGILLSGLIDNGDISCKHIFALHYNPGAFEESHISFENRKRKCRNNSFSLEGLKLLIYPIYYQIMSSKFRERYRIIENKADMIVLLSHHYKNEWCEYAYGKLKENSLKKLYAIPNALTFDYFADNSDIMNKEKRILVVGRLDERQKKISRVLKIWQDIAYRPVFKDWELDIVGDGPDKNLYISIVNDNRIPRVHFHGRQNPEIFYKRSSLFLMTSDYEGFAMTLNEASQYGAIPFVFNTFTSLTAIIEQGKNGFIFDPDDYESFENMLECIAEDNNERMRIATNAVKNAKRFTRERIAGMWECLIQPEDVSQN